MSDFVNQVNDNGQLYDIWDKRFKEGSAVFDIAFTSDDYVFDGMGHYNMTDAGMAKLQAITTSGVYKGTGSTNGAGPFVSSGIIYCNEQPKQYILHSFAEASYGPLVVKCNRIVINSDKSITSLEQTLLPLYTSSDGSYKWDTTPTENSTKPVTSDGIFKAKGTKLYKHFLVDSTHSTSIEVISTISTPCSTANNYNELMNKCLCLNNTYSHQGTLQLKQVGAPSSGTYKRYVLSEDGTISITELNLVANFTDTVTQL